MAASASAASTRSQTSKASHAVSSNCPEYQVRNRLTSRSNAPRVTSNGPDSSLRVIESSSARASVPSI